MTIQDKLAKAKKFADQIVVITKAYDHISDDEQSRILTKAAEIYDLIEELQGDLANRSV